MKNLILRLLKHRVLTIEIQPVVKIFFVRWEKVFPFWDG